MSSTNIEPENWEDVDTILRERHKTRDEFVFREAVDPQSGATTGTLIVTHVQSRVSRRYQTGFGTAWETGFATDLDAHIFEGG